MISKWYGLREKAIKLRLKGYSIPDVEARLGIPRSTLSGWFKHVKISIKHKKALYRRWELALVKAREGSVKWHNTQKAARLKTAETAAQELIGRLDLANKEVLELALAMLYLGEGFKKKSETAIGNSDPMILLFFITILKKVYGTDTKNMTCFLHLRADQNPEILKQWWSDTLGIPIENFRKASIDKRTVGSKTYDSYKGVCIVRCGNVAIQRKLVYLSRIYCERIIANLRA